MDSDFGQVLGSGAFAWVCVCVFSGVSGICVCVWVCVCACVCACVCFVRSRVCAGGKQKSMYSVCYLLAPPSSSYTGNCQESFVHMICYYILHMYIYYIYAINYVFDGQGVLTKSLL